MLDYIRQLINALSTLYKEDLSQLPTEIVRKILAARDKIGRKGDVYQRAQAVEDDISHVRSWIDYELSRGESDIIVPYVQSSYLETSRDIIVTGIVARTVHPNTTLILGRLKARTEILLESVEIRIVKDRLVISSRSGTITMDD